MTPTPDYDAMGKFAELATEPLCLTLNPGEIEHLIVAGMLALDAIAHINRTGETLDSGTTGGWAGPERFGRDPEGVLDAEVKGLEEVIAKLREVQDRNKGKRQKLYQRIKRSQE